MSDASEFDLGGEGGVSAPPATLEVLHKIVEETVALEKIVLQQEEDLKATKKTLQALKTQRLPEMMASLQMSEMTRDGWKIKVSDFISGSLPQEPERREKAIEWLINNDGEPLIKTTIELTFSKSEHNMALSLADDLKKMGLEPTISSGVHSATLQSFARQKLKDGSEIDTDLLGLFTGKVAKLTPPKEKK